MWEKEGRRGKKGLKHQKVCVPPKDDGLMAVPKGLNGGVIPPSGRV